MYRPCENEEKQKVGRWYSYTFFKYFRQEPVALVFPESEMVSELYSLNKAHVIRKERLKC